MTGRTVSHYRITEKLGGGGMGVVYKAEDLKLHRTVALKFLPPELTRDEEAKKRFIHEAEAASSLDHNNICVIHEIDEADGQLFICMNNYEGETLKSKISSGSIKTKEAFDIAIQIAEGLNTAHEKGIVHRDIKPANIFITSKGIIKILDFGLAKLRSQNQLTRTGSILGTVSYMSPEQARGEQVDHRTDIWSLGIVLYEMLTGSLPFKGEYDQAMIFSILNDEPLLMDVPIDAVQIIERMLKKDPAARFSNCNDVVDFVNQIIITEKFTPAEQKAGPSIAVLPFVNMSADPENEYFSDGLSEDIISSLTKIKNLRVVARTSSFSFKGMITDIREIGRKLNVETVLEGSIRKAGNRLRITAQLINTKDGYHLWSEQFNRVMDDVFTIQDEITTAIVERLKGELLGEDKDNLVKKTAQNYEAYNLYLKGRYLLNQRIEKTIKQSILLFEQAIKEDPRYAPAYAGLADSYNMLGAGDYGIMPPGEAFPKAKKAAETALELDSSLAEAYTALGWAVTNYDWDWKGGANAYKRAIELNPGYATAHHWYAIYLSLTGDHSKAIQEGKKAAELDPLSLIINSDVAWVLNRAREYDLAIQQCHKTLSIDPYFSVARWNLGHSYQKKGMYKEAVEEFQKSVSYSEGNPVFLAALGHTYALAGKGDQAREILDQLNQMSASKYIQPHLQALIYTGLGDNDQAFKWLEKAYKDRTDFIIEAKEDPALDTLRSDPRFDALIKRTGIPEKNG